MENRTLTDEQKQEAIAIGWAVRRVQKRRRGRGFAGRFLGHATVADSWNDSECLSINGWYVVGEGLFSKVLAHPDRDYVIKVSGNGNFGYTKSGESTVGGESFEDSWPLYAEWCMRNAGKSPHLPDIRLLHWISNSVCVSVIEHLYHTDDRENKRVLWRKMLNGYVVCESWLLGVKSLRDELELRVDLHSENVMARTDENGEEVVVMTDPFSWTEG